MREEPRCSSPCSRLYLLERARESEKDLLLPLYLPTLPPSFHDNDNADRQLLLSLPALTNESEKERRWEKKGSQPPSS